MRFDALPTHADGAAERAPVRSPPAAASVAGHAPFPCGEVSQGYGRFQHRGDVTLIIFQRVEKVEVLQTAGGDERRPIPAGDMLSRQGLGHWIPGRGVSACPHRRPRRPTDGDASLRASPTPPKLNGRRWGHALTSTAPRTWPTPRRESMSPVARANRPSPHPAGPPLGGQAAP